MTTQLDASIGLSIAESTYKTGVTATKFFEFTDESLDWDPTFIQGQGLRVAARTARSARRAIGKQRATGDFTLEAPSKGLGVLLNAAFGTATSTLISGTSYQQVHTPTTTDYLNSYTIQKGVPPLGGGATNAITFAGAVCKTIEFDCKNSDFLTIKTAWDMGATPATGTAYAAPSYPTPIELFNFTQGAITIGGSVTAPTTTALATGGTSVADIRDFNLVYDNNLDDNGFNFGSSGTRARKPAVGMADIKGKLTAEYDSATLRDAYLAQTDLALTLTFTALSTISGSIHPTLQIYVPNIRLEGELPKANGGDVITQSIDFTGFDNLSATSQIFVTYITADTAI